MRLLLDHAIEQIVRAAHIAGALLREFVRLGAEPQHTFMRPPRRFQEMLGIVPGRFRRPNRASVMTIVDTSGSVGARDLSLISSELEVIAATNDVVVVECDARFVVCIHSRQA